MTSPSRNETSADFFWNGRRLSAAPGDSLAAALMRNGITTVARSRKLHRPLGYSGSHVVGILARVDGRPNVRLDQEPVRPGCRVEAQNVWPSAGFDLLRGFQLLPPKAVYGGFEHGRFTPSQGGAYMMWERMMAFLAGVAEPPSKEHHGARRPGSRLDCDLLVVGAGPAGCKAANEAAAQGRSVIVVTRGETAGRFATAMGAPPEPLDARITFLPAMDLFGGYRGGKLFVAAPHRHDQGAIAIHAEEALLATGRRSMPPLVKGNQLPGVMDAHAALDLVHRHGLKLGSRVAVIGSGAEQAVAARLAELGVNVVHRGAAKDLAKVVGRGQVRAIRLSSGQIPCDVVVHAGPWRVDPSLPFQITAEGELQLVGGLLPAHVVLGGAAAGPSEPVHIPARLSPDALVCPCMDVTVGEIVLHVDNGETDPEVLKRLTSCGMGPCQGYPCWDNMLAVLAHRTGGRPEDFRRPSHRAPRRAITVAQAAGLADVIAPQ